jgi:hypothetical protein
MARPMRRAAPVTKAFRAIFDSALMIFPVSHATIPVALQRDDKAFSIKTTPDM